MRTCMVIQPFDGGEFDKRFRDVFTPAIQKAGMKPYRVDEDPTTTVIIDRIENIIRDADACLADISIPNANVWYEVGYAFAARKDVVMVCKKGVTLPFDVRHRAIIHYVQDSPTDFKQLQSDITQRLLAFDKVEKAIEEITQVKPSYGLNPHETVTLIILMEDSLASSDGIPGYQLARDMEKAGFTKAGAAMGMQGLIKKKFATKSQVKNNFDDPYDCYAITELGIEWCLNNQDRINTQYEEPTQGDDDIPF